MSLFAKLISALRSELEHFALLCSWTRELPWSDIVRRGRSRPESTIEEPGAPYNEPGSGSYTWTPPTSESSARWRFLTQVTESLRRGIQAQPTWERNWA